MWVIFGWETGAFLVPLVPLPTSLRTSVENPGEEGIPGALCEIRVEAGVVTGSLEQSR